MYDTQEEECNLELLKNPKQKGFLDEIQSAHIYLTPDQIEDYYSIVLSHFQKDISIECGRSILRSLCWVLSNDAFLNEFLESRNQYPLQLPFSQNEYLEDVFDVLYIIVTRKPEYFDDQLIDQFNKKAKKKGFKSLTILSIYAQHFNDITDPYPMLQVLFDNFRRFSKVDVADKYAGLLATLVQSYPEFRRDKGKESWEVVCKLLDEIPINDGDAKNNKLINIIANIYGSLATIASYLRFSFSGQNNRSGEKKGVFNFEYIISHFKYEPLQKPIISFLLVVPIEHRQLKDQEFLKALIDVSLKDEDHNDIFVLMKLAEDKIISQTLIEKLPFWMEESDPFYDHTLQLFLIIFQHTSLRPLIANCPEFLTFLYNIINSKDHPKSSLSIVSKIIRRIDFTDEILDEICANNIISSFMKNAQVENPDDATAGVGLLEKVSSFGFRKELAQNCQWIFDVIKEYQDSDSDYILNSAIDVATLMAKYKKCARKFTEIGMVDYFDKLSRKKQYQKVANRFLKIFS